MGAQFGYEGSYTLQEVCPASYEIGEKFKNLISFLSFFKKSGQLYMLDRLSNAIDANTVLSILAEMESLVARLKPQSGNYCFVDEIEEIEVEWYRRLGVEDVEPVKEKGRYIIRVECPRWPSKDELELLARCIEEMKIRPTSIIAYVYAYGW
jgi:hypothetical protein